MGAAINKLNDVDDINFRLGFFPVTKQQVKFSLFYRPMKELMKLCKSQPIMDCGHV